MPCNEASPDKRNKAARYKPWWSVAKKCFLQPAELHLPCETSHERDKLIEILRASPAEYRATHNNNKPERVLLPFHIPIHLPTSSEEPILHDPHGGEELQWHGKQNRERIQELNGLRKA